MPVVVVTLPEESGVYDYHRLLVYRVDSGRLVALQQPVVEFSGLGSWRCVKNRIVDWEGLIKIGKESHFDSHHYRVDQYVIQAGRLIREKSEVTRRRYSVDWLDQSGRLPTRRQDPLAEFHLRWSWW